MPRIHRPPWDTLGLTLGKESNKIKSGAVIFGNHHSHIASIIEHSGLTVAPGGAIVPITQSHNNDEIEIPRLTGLG